MTYCLGMLLDAGLIMIADTRTNAGVDDISSYRKLHTLIDTPERSIFAASAGNLSTTQMVMSLLREGVPTRDGGSDDEEEPLLRTIAEPTTMFRAAQLVGDAVRFANDTVGRALAALHISASSSILLGGRIGDAPPSLYMIYSAGNFIECKPDVPFFQIGETKYGRPIIVRSYDPAMSFEDSVKLLCVSFDSTIRANAGVDLPIDLKIHERDDYTTVRERRFERGDPYFESVANGWAEALGIALAELPDFHF